MFLSLCAFLTLRLCSRQAVCGIVGFDYVQWAVVNPPRMGNVNVRMQDKRADGGCCDRSILRLCVE